METIDATSKDKKIVELDPGAALTGEELFYAVQGDKDVKIKAKDIAALAPSPLPAGGVDGQILEVDVDGNPQWSDSLTNTNTAVTDLTAFALDTDKKAAQAIQDAAHAQATADLVQISADAALTDAQQAQTTANTAKTTADQAMTKATEAKTTADHALAVANAGGGSGGTAVKELPDYPATDAAGQALVIGADGQSVEWSDGLSKSLTQAINTANSAQSDATIARAGLQAKVDKNHTNEMTTDTLLFTRENDPFQVTLRNSAGEVSTYVHDDGAVGLQGKLGTAAVKSIIARAANGNFSIDGGRITINSAGTVSLQVPPAGTANGNEATTAGWVLGRVTAKTAPIETELGTVKTTADDALAKANTLQTSVSGLSTAYSSTWAGSQAQYDAISPKDPNTLYIVVP